MPKATPTTREDLPQHLGLGTLDPGSVSTTTGKTTANYVLGDEIVYQITMGKKTCGIVEFLDGQELGRSKGVTLKDAFLHHMMSLPPYENRRFERIYHQITDKRNISARFATQPQAIFYPAGYIFVLRQPIVASNQAKWNKLKARLERKRDAAPVQVEGEYKAVIFRLLQSGKVKTEKIIVADFSTTLVNLVAATDMLCKSGIVPRDKEYRLSVMDTLESLPGSMPIYLGDPEGDTVTFSVFVTEGLKVNMKQAAEHFLDSSKQFLDSLD